MPGRHGRRHVRVSGEVEVGVEIADQLPLALPLRRAGQDRTALVLAEGQVMRQRVDPGRRHVRIGVEIGLGREVGAGAPAFALAVLELSGFSSFT